MRGVELCGDISRAIKIDGWMSETELQVLADAAIRHNVIVEVGSYLGRSTLAFADNVSGVVYAYDRWQQHPELKDPNPETIWLRFVKNVAWHERIVPIRCDHSDPPDPPVRPDLVFIDGGHSYEEAKRDILFWLPRLKPGGVLCGHDADWPGVWKAVTEILGSDIPVVTGTVIWVWYKPEVH